MLTRDAQPPCLVLCGVLFDRALVCNPCRGKLVGEAVVQPELDAHANGEGVPSLAT